MYIDLIGRQDNSKKEPIKNNTQNLGMYCPMNKAYLDFVIQKHEERRQQTNIIVYKVCLFQHKLSPGHHIQYLHPGKESSYDSLQRFKMANSSNRKHLDWKHHTLAWLVHSPR